MDDGLKQRRSVILKAWGRWLVLFVPLFAATQITGPWVGFGWSMVALITVFASTLLYQRYVNKRSWRSIMWGVHAKR